MREFNFANKRCDPRDIKTLFCDDDLIIFFDDNFKYEDLWVKVGLFKSKSEARKNNHGGVIKPGWDSIIKKKQGISVFILQYMEGLTPYDDVQPSNDGQETAA